jgi:hypothetical protein
MLNFNGGTSIAGTSIASMGLYVGVFLLRSGDFAVALCFLLLTCVYFTIVISTLCRFFINYRRNREIVREDYKLTY